MFNKTPVTKDATESLIESLHAARQKRSLVLNPDYLDDEKLPEEERAAVLKEIFNRKIREKQISRIISHLAPLLDGIHPPPALIFGPTGSGKTVTLIHVLSTFKKVAERRGIGFRYHYVDLSSPKTFFGALNEVDVALDSSNRKYRKGKAVSVAEETSGRLTEKEVDIAESQLEVDKTVALIRALASQQRFALQACYAALARGQKKVSTGQAYEEYRRIAEGEQLRPLTQRRFSDIIGFLDLYGLINARIISKGRYGNTREISSSLTDEVVQKFLRNKI